jgi:hypothetical protein
MPTLSRVLRTVAVVVAAVALTPTVARAAETEPHYGWFFPPRDGSRGINAAVAAAVAAALVDINHSADAETLRCEEVAVRATARLSPTAGWFFLGLTRSWDVDFSPATSTEYVDRFLPISIYRTAQLFPFGQVVPVDPAVRVGDIVFGTDKIAHFFTNGARYFVRWNTERGVVGDDEAEARAIEDGVDEERGILGRWASGIFSYADLEANFSGLGFYRGLCEGKTPALRVVDGRWQMDPFDIARLVTPCWDEAFAPSAFAAADAAAIRAALVDDCPRWRRDPVQRRRRAYAKRGCSASHQRLQQRVMTGDLPDPRPFDIAAICGSHPMNVDEEFSIDQ